MHLLTDCPEQGRVATRDMSVAKSKPLISSLASTWEFDLGSAQLPNGPVHQPCSADRVEPIVQPQGTRQPARSANGNPA